MKDAAQDVADDATQVVAEGVLGAAEDGSSSVSGGKIIVTPVACPQLPPTPTPPKVSSSTVSSRQALFECVKSLCWCGRPSDSGGRLVKGEHEKDAANATSQGQKRYAAARDDPDSSLPRIRHFQYGPPPIGRPKDRRLFSIERCPSLDPGAYL